MNQNVTEIGGLLYFLTYISDYLPYTLIEIIGKKIIFKIINKKIKHINLYFLNRYFNRSYRLR